MRTGILAGIIVALLLSGCTNVNDQVRVVAVNETTQSVTLDVWVAFVPTSGAVQVITEGGVTVKAGESYTLASFLRPCEDRQVGDVVVRVEILNGTTAESRETWTADGCASQHASVRLGTDRVGIIWSTA